jgi:hypothetical protein
LAFFKPDDKEMPNPCDVGTHLEKYAKCQVPLVPGGTRLCNKRTKQGLNNHLRTQHPAAFTRLKKEKAQLERVATGAKRAITNTMTI